MKTFRAILAYDNGFPVDWVGIKAQNKSLAKFILGFTDIIYVDFWTLVEEHGTEG